MTDKSQPKSGKGKPAVEKLELKKETVRNLTEDEAAAVAGGQQAQPTQVRCPDTHDCPGKKHQTHGRRCTHHCDPDRP